MKNPVDELKSMTLNIKPDDYAPKPKRDALLSTREASHGSYTETAHVAQELKGLVVSRPNYTKLNHRQRESLDLIATKIGRILAGDPNFKDHWDDIAGYAKLGSEACD